MWVFLLFSCQDNSISSEDIEREALQSAETVQNPSSEPVLIPVAGLDNGSQTQNLEIESTLKPVDVVFTWDNVGPLFQQLLQDTTAQIYLHKGFQSLQSPVVLAVRWLEDADGMSVGQIALQYEKPIQNWQDLQAPADALLQYRSFLGGNYDLRLWSFQLFIEGGKCRIPILNQDPGVKAVLSPCVEYLGDKHCGRLEPDSAQIVISTSMQRILNSCFP